MQVNYSKILTIILSSCSPDKRQFLESIQGFVNTFNKRKTNIDKPKKTSTIIKSSKHMKPQQWKIFMCLKKEVNKQRVKSGTIDIPKSLFITLGIFGDKIGQDDTAISRFNTDYNKIMGISKQDSEKVIWTKISDTNYYQFSVSKLLSLYNHITNPKKNDDNMLFEEFLKYILLMLKTETY